MLPFRQILRLVVCLSVTIVIAQQCTGPIPAKASNHHMPSHLAFAVGLDAKQAVQNCAKLCLQTKACQSFSYNRINSECELYFVNSITNKEDMLFSLDWLYSDKSEWPTVIAGTCDGHNCGLHQRCVPLVNNAMCVNMKEHLSCSIDTCLNEGTCFETLYSYGCTCVPDWVGTRCEDPACANGWTFWNGHCYKIFFEYNKAFSRGMEVCANEGAYLTDVHSIEEQEFIHGLVQVEKHSVQAKYVNDMIRVGGSKLNSEGTWLWVSNGDVPFSEELIWNPGELDPLDGGSCATIRFDKDRKYMGDSSCNAYKTSRGYLCKKTSL